MARKTNAPPRELQALDEALRSIIRALLQQDNAADEVTATLTVHLAHRVGEIVGEETAR